MLRLCASSPLSVSILRVFTLFVGGCVRSVDSIMVMVMVIQGSCSPLRRLLWLSIPALFFFFVFFFFGFTISISSYSSVENFKPPPFFAFFLHITYITYPTPHPLKSTPPPFPSLLSFPSFYIPLYKQTSPKSIRSPLHDAILTVPAY